jgi:PAS domain S-box-containing protein
VRILQHDDIKDLKQTEAALEQREHQLRELIETIPAMLWCNNPRGELTYINRKTSEFVGLGISQLADLGYQKTTHPDDLDSLVQAWTHSIETGEPYRHVARLHPKGGVYRWYRHTAEAMRDSDGNIVQWYGLSLDIDEPKRAENRLRQTLAELARATQTFQKRKRNVKDMVLGAVRLLREDETRRTADIDFDLPDGLPPVFVDQIQIQQILFNLITNGIEATEDSGRTPKILITAPP